MKSLLSLFPHFTVTYFLIITFGLEDHVNLEDRGVVHRKTIWHDVHSQSRIKSGKINISSGPSAQKGWKVLFYFSL